MSGRMSFEELREMLLYRRIVKWEGNSITLDNGIEISIEETAQDCCACASGEFTDVVLDAAITNVGNIEYEPWDTKDKEYADGEYGCNATVTIMHNRNVICKAVGGADAGNGGYYYSIASFVVKIPAVGVKVCHFVGSEDGSDADREKCVSECDMLIEEYRKRLCDAEFRAATAEKENTMLKECIVRMTLGRYGVLND